MDYKNGKIYKVQFDDGHYYIGSTAGELRRRLFEHRCKASDNACSKHMKEVGKDTCRIVLVEDYPCESREHLHRKEDEHIQAHRGNELCLNIFRAFRTDEEVQKRGSIYYAANKEQALERQKEYYQAHKEERLAYAKVYHAKKKASQTEASAVSGEVGLNAGAVAP